MRHGKKGFKLGRTAAHRKATLAALSTALIEHKQIRTTLTKAKAARQYIEPLITRSRDDTTHNRRMVFRYLQNKYAVTELFDEVAERVGDRPGGYTRIVRLGPRKGDGAEMAIIELVDYNESEPVETTTKRRRTRRGSGRSRPAETAPAVADVDVAELEEDLEEAPVDEVEEPEAEVPEEASEEVAEEAVTNEAVAEEAPEADVAEAGAEEEAAEGVTEAVAEEAAEAPVDMADEAPQEPEAESPEEVPSSEAADEEEEKKGEG